MKKIIVVLALFCLMIASASALVTFTGAPSLPYIIFGFVDWQGQNLGGARVEITNQNTGYSTIIRTNIDGYWQEEGSNWLTTFAERDPVLAGDIIKVKSLDGCGTNDVCEKTFTAKINPNKFSAQLDLSLSGVLIPPSPDGGSGDGGGGGGGGGGSVPAWNCEEWTVCADGVQTRLCTQEGGYFTRREKQDCVISEPVIVPPIEEPVIPIEEPITPIEPTIPTELIVPPEPESNLLIYLISLIAGILALFGWGRGFAGLIKYKLKQADIAEKAGNKELAKKYRATAEKMAKSIITNYLAGKYKK